MMKKIIFCVPAIALIPLFAASSYHVKLYDKSSIGGKTLEPGDYKLELTGQGVILKNNKEETSAPAKIETTEKKFDNTTVRLNDKHELQEIHLGGTNKKIVIGNTQSQTANGGL